MLTRRNMFKASLIAGVSAAGLGGSAFAEEGAKHCRGARGALIYPDLLGWKIGPQIYSFNRFPFDEAIKLVAKCNVKSFELFSGQKLSRGSDESVGPNMSKGAFKRFRELLIENNVVPHAMGVCPADRAHFEFAAACGFSVINVEPQFEDLPQVDKLAQEYKINVGIHNHPKASRYWDPKVVLERLADCSDWIAACCDTGHWLRSELDPLECVKMFNGRIASFHIKDLTPEKVDIPLGQGVCKIADILAVCAEARLRIPFSIEYESDWDNNQPLVAEGIKFFNETARKIVEG
ncbi:MAG: sugar phosphate isomerase/epimerase family protein [Thermoguttaceae bacterium]|jgi:sugar phosphate isomerase/epimerase